MGFFLPAFENFERPEVVVRVVRSSISFRRLEHEESTLLELFHWHFPTISKTNEQSSKNNVESFVQPEVVR